MPSGKWERNTRIKKNQPFICHVRKFREEMGLTTRELAGKCKLPNSTITSTELQGNARISTVLTLARVLNRSVEELWQPKRRKSMKAKQRETKAGDVLREPQREQFDNPVDFAEARALWQEARPL